MKLFNSINQFLLKRYPALWNLRLIPFLIVVGALHVLFFIGGYLRVTGKEVLKSLRLSDSYFTSGLVVLGLLISFVVIVRWLWLYTRNNALRRALPKSVSSIWLEFIGGFVFILLAISFYFSFTYGMVARTKSMNSKEVVHQQIEDYNIATTFFPTQAMDYGTDRRCCDVAVFDSLVSYPELYAALTNNDHNLLHDGLDSISFDEFLKQLNAENLPTFLEEAELKPYQLDGYHNVVRDELDSRNILPNDQNEYAEAIVESRADEYGYFNNYYSLWNYCKTELDLPKLKTIDKDRIHDILSSPSSDSIAWYQDRMLALANEYEVGYQFKEKPLKEYTGNHPYYLVDFMQNYEPTQYEYDYNLGKRDYFEVHNLNNALRQQYNAHHWHFEEGGWLVVLYVALGLALLLLAYRVLGVRSWFLALLFGVGIIILYALILTTLNFLSFSRGELFANAVAFIFVVTFNLLAFTLILNRYKRTLGGYAFCWAVITLPGIVPMIYFFIMQSIPATIKNPNLKPGEPLKIINPKYEYWDSLAMPIYFVNVVLVLALAYIFVWLGRRWVAIPKDN